MNLERVSRRSMDYSRMRRTLGQRLYMFDLDDIEVVYVNNKPVIAAFIETKHSHESLPETQKQLLKTLARDSGKPVFCVWHHHKTDTDWIFIVRDMITNESEVMNMQQYENFLIKLRVLAIENEHSRRNI